MVRLAVADLADEGDEGGDQPFALVVVDELRRQPVAPVRQPRQLIGMVRVLRRDFAGHKGTILRTRRG